MKTAGIILAAGASSRMGMPKALLQTPEGQPLAVEQYLLLEDAGCQPVVVVLGCDYETILPHVTICRVAYNPGWQRGRFSSVQAGLHAVEAGGYLILPVDTVGVRSATIMDVLEFASGTTAAAVRPTYRGEAGRIAWLSHALAVELLAMDPEGGRTRLDEILKGRAQVMPVDDPAILTNVNTPDEWERALKALPVA